MNNTMSTPSGGGSGTESKAKKKQNLVPVQISEILNSPEEGFTVEGSEVGMVVVVGKVMSYEKATTKTTYRVQDDSGEIEVIQWLEEGTNQPEHAESHPIKVVGSIRSHQDKKHIMAFKISEVQSQAEYDAHLLEVVYSHLKLRQLQQKINGQIMGSDGSLSQSMMGGGLGIQGGAASSYVSSSANQSFGNKNYDLVYGLIKQSTDEAGIDRDSVFGGVKKNMSKNEMDNALDFLFSEGHIYSTIDEDHFKTTDGD